MVEFSSWVILLLVVYATITSGGAAQLVVARDGSGTHRSISEALAAAPNYSTTPVQILIKKGVYNEYIVVPQWKSNIILKGSDDNSQTVIWGNKNLSVDIRSTQETATFVVEGNGFIAQDITFSNTAGPAAGQAVAFRSVADKTILYRCKIQGYQDTLYSQRGRHFFRDTDIYGTVDFIFGDSKAFFQNCNLYFRIPQRGQSNVLTAQGRVSEDNSTGIIFQNCTLSPDPLSKAPSRESYLGRPWRNYSRTVVMESYMDTVINQHGWMPWDQDNSSLSQVYYAEYHNRGPGSETSGRIKCPGCKVIEDRQEAEQFSVRNFMDGLDWIPSTGIPVYADLIS